MPLDYRSSLDDSDFQRAMSRMEKSATTGAASIARGFGVASVAAVSVGTAIAGIVGESVRFASAIGDSAEAMNLAVDSYQGYIGVLEQGGVSQERFERSFTKFLTSVDDAREGNEKLIGSFEKLGVTWEMLSGGTPEELFEAVAKGLQNAGDETQSFGAAMDLFGKGSARMIGQLRAAGEDLDTYAKQVGKIGNEQQRILDAWGDKWTEWGRKAKSGIANALSGLVDRNMTLLMQAKNLITGGDDSLKLPSATPDAARRGTPGPDPRLVKRDEENRKLLKESQREYDKLAAEAADDAEKAAQKTDEECEAIERKIRLQEREIEIEQRLLKVQTEAQRRMDEAVNEGDRLRGINADIRSNALAFGMLSGDERRQTVRDERDVKREQARQDRLIRKGQTDARFGARGEGRDIADIGLNQATIDALKRAWLEAAGQLVAG